MLKTTTRASAIAAVCALGATAQAQDGFVLGSAADLAALCGAADSETFYVAAINLCHGYMMGAAAVHHEMTQAGIKPIYCVTDANRPSLSQASAAFSAWAETASNLGQTKPIDGLFAWARAAFPCPN